MDAIEENVWQAAMFRKSRLLYLYCIDPGYVSELTIPNLPFLKLKCLFGHVSFPGSLSERPGGPVAHSSFSTVFLSSGKSTRMHRSASGLGVQNGRR